MKITKLNYELYIIDYLERTLDSSEQLAFEVFLEQNPDVQKEVATYLQAPVLSENEEIVMKNKNDMKKRRGGLWVAFLSSMIMLFLLAFGLYSWTNTRTPKPSNVQVEKERVERPASIEEEMREETVELEPIELSVEKKILATPVKKEIKPQIKQNKAKVIEQRTESFQREDEELDIWLEPNRIIPSNLNGTNIKTNMVQPIEENEDVKIENQRPLMASLEKISRPDYFVEILDQPQDSGWKNVFTPAAYKELDIKKAIVSRDLKTAAEEIGDAIKPKLITK